ncbi:amino acid adenylation domain-containing protein [Nostoc carneum NIES-2107]|nr:amino acid adenylation domain-containing protein [Nostoc carneum NIES-2107]
MKTLDELLSELRQRDVKLWLEGDRLRYRAAKDSLTPELLNELKTQKAEIINFLRQVTTNATSKIPPIVACERTGNLPVSFGQQRLWFLHQFEPNSSSNNMPVVVRFTGNLNVAILEESLREVVRRHEVLRTTFPAVNGKPTQVIATDVSLKLPVIDLQQVPEEQRETEAHILATKEAHQPFDLANGPVLRVLLLRLSDREHLLIWNMHSIVCDGASSDVFYQDFTTIYKALSAGLPSPLPPLPVQYADFTHWQHQWLQGEVLESQVNYWKQKLEGNLPIIDLPYDHPRPQGAQTYRGDRAALLLPKTLNHALTDLSQKWGATLFMTLLTVFELLLYRYSGQEDLLVSFASAGRGQVETERLIGFFSNTLVLRSNLAGNPTFRELLDRVRKDCLEAYSHQDLPFERLIEELKPEQQSRNTSSLFQVKFSLNPPWSNGRGMAAVELPDLTITSLFGYIYHGKTKYDLTLVLREQDNGLGMVFDYNAEMFDTSTVEQMLGHYKTLLEGIVANPDQPISELPLLLDHQVKSSQNLTNNQIEKTFVPAQDSVQIQLTEIWQNFLGIHPIGITDNFFDLGGHSLIAVRLFAEIEKRFGKTLPLSILLQAPTIEQLAHYLRDKSPEKQANIEKPRHLVKDFFGKAIFKVFKGGNYPQITEENQTNLETREWLPSSSLVPLQPNGNKPPLFCVHGAGESVLYYRDFANYLGVDQPVYALQAIGVDGKKAPLTRVEKMAAHYIKEIQTIQPQGPYLLGGYSFGGLVVWEMARQLAAQGQKVALLALFDTSNTIRLQANIKPIPTQKRISRHWDNLIEIGPEYILHQIEGKRSWIDYMVKRKLNKLTFKAYLNISRFLPYTYRKQVKIKDFNKQAAKEYVPKAYVGRVTVFRAEERPANNGGVVDPNMGWGELALGGLDIQHVPGNHFSIFNEPYVQSLSEKMKVCIEQAMAEA